MKSYKKIYNRGNLYFDTYHIYDDANRCFVGILEDHCRQVKSQYFIGWHFESEFIPNTFQPGRTEFFYTEKEAMSYITENYTK